MSEDTVDARGQSCPVPVIRTRDALDVPGSDVVTVLLDEEVAKENVTRLARSRGCSVKMSEEAGEYRLVIRKDAGQ